MTRLSQQQKKIICEMNAAGAEYLVIGGMAIRAHGFKRPTSDLDLVIGARSCGAKSARNLLPSYRPTVSQPYHPVTF
jgi:hypothetical protein